MNSYSIQNIWNSKCLVLMLILLQLSLFNNVKGSFPPGTVLDIKLGNVVIEQFSYIPTREGYQYGYTLPSGVHRDEVGLLLNDRSTPEDLQNATNFDRNARPSRRPGLKNRKLSPKSLSSLAG